MPKIQTANTDRILKFLQQAVLSLDPPAPRQEIPMSPDHQSLKLSESLPFESLNPTRLDRGFNQQSQVTGHPSAPTLRHPDSTGDQNNKIISFDSVQISNTHGRKWNPNQQSGVPRDPSAPIPKTQTTYTDELLNKLNLRQTQISKIQKVSFRSIITWWCSPWTRRPRHKKYSCPQLIRV